MTLNFKAAWKAFIDKDVAIGPFLRTKIEPDVLDYAHQLINHAEKFAAGTSATYRRAWVYEKMVESFPKEDKRKLDLAISLALNNIGLD